MVVRCSACSAAYKMDAERIPATGVRVRCPRCAHVFRVRTLDPVGPRAKSWLASSATIAPRRASARARAGRLGAGTAAMDRKRRPLPARSRLESRAHPRARGARPRQGSGTTSGDDAVPFRRWPSIPATAGRRHRRLRQRPHRRTNGRVGSRASWSRTSWSTIRRCAIGPSARATWPVALAAEISKAWDLYKSKVSPETSRAARPSSRTPSTRSWPTATKVF